jgi:acetylornithine deacetylase/succinyl-diaminopimelate desuccinylase-like protein
MKKVIDNPAVEIVRRGGVQRPATPPSRIDTDMFRALEAVQKRMYPDIRTLPTMSTGATDMSLLRAKGMQCYGIGPAVDVEDAPAGYGSHSDQERILESALHDFVRFTYDAVTEVGARQR